METLFYLQFGYCPLTWMFCGRKASSRINHLHEEALRIIYTNRDLSFGKKAGSFTIHYRSIQTLSRELFKVKNCLESEIRSNIFEKNQIANYCIRFQNDFSHSLW